MTVVPLEAEERAKQREIRWISLNGNPTSEKMTTSDNCLAHIHGIVRGETANLGDLFVFFRDPETFKSGELRNPIDLWGKNLKGLEMSKDVLKWLEHGVDIKIHKTF